MSELLRAPQCFVEQWGLSGLAGALLSAWHTRLRGTGTGAGARGGPQTAARWTARAPKAVHWAAAVHVTGVVVVAASVGSCAAEITVGAASVAVNRMAIVTVIAVAPAHAPVPVPEVEVVVPVNVAAAGVVVGLRLAAAVAATAAGIVHGAVAVYTVAVTAVVTAVAMGWAASWAGAVTVTATVYVPVPPVVVAMARANVLEPLPAAALTAMAARVAVDATPPFGPSEAARGTVAAAARVPVSPVRVVAAVAERGHLDAVLAVTVAVAVVLTVGVHAAAAGAAGAAAVSVHLLVASPRLWWYPQVPRSPSSSHLHIFGPAGETLSMACAPHRTSSTPRRTLRVAR